MARIRTIKPEFFCHEELFDLEAETGLPIRIAFAGLWTVCDRDGRFVWRPRTLKAQVMPHDAVDFGQVLDALERGGFVQSYVAEGVKCGFVPSWKRHQIINTRESVSKIPPPPHEKDSAEHVRARACTSQGIEYRGVNIAPALRETILARDGCKCCRCGATEDMTVDHIFPQSMGGNHAPQNLRAMCRKCNSARPVAGKALIADLAKDGFTLDDMQRMCMHVPDPVHAQGEWNGMEGNGKGKEGEWEGDHAHTPPILKSIQPPDELTPHWNRWCEYSLAIGKPVNAIQADTLLMELGRRGTAKAIRDIDFSIRKSAKSILDSDNDFEKQASQPRSYAPAQKTRNYT